MADLKQIKVGDTTYNIEPYTSYLPLAGGKMTGNLQMTENSTSILLRSGSETWYSGIYANSSGDEVLGIVAVNPRTHIMLGTANPLTRPAATSLTPAIDIKNGKVGINKRLGTDGAADAGSYNLDVNGSINASGTIDANSARIGNGLYVGTSITHNDQTDLVIGNSTNGGYVYFVEDVAGGSTPDEGDNLWSISNAGTAYFASLYEGGVALSNKYAPKAWISANPSVTGLASASTTATGALAVGLGSTAHTNSIAIGESASSTGDSVAIGKGAVADYSIAIGKGVNTDKKTSSVAIAGAVGGTGGVCVGYSSAAYSTYGAAIGNNSNAYGMYSLALAYGSQAGPSTSAASSYVAVGHNAKALGTACSLAVGYSAYSTSGSVVVGMSATGTGYISTVIGPSAQSIAAYGTAVGGSSKATGYYGTAVGYGANAAGSASVALGYSATGSGSYSVAIGYGSQATICGAVAVGYSVEATATGAIGIGYNATGSGRYGVAIGYNSSATATGAIGIGYSANATAWGAIGIGYDTNAEGSYSTLIGYGSTASSAHSYGIGIGYFTTPHYNSIMIGNEISEDGATISSYSIAIGSAESSYIDSYESYNTPSPIETGLASIAIGSAFIYPDDDSSYYGCASALGEAAIAIGPDSNAYGENAISIGIGSSSKGYLSTAVGPFSDANASYSTSLGYGTHASGTHSVAVGAYARAYGKGIAIGYSVTAGNASYPTATTAASGAYAIAIGHNISAGVSGSRSLIKIGATGKNYYFYAGGSGWSSGSDERDKTDINPINNALTLIKEIQPITYRYNRRGDYSDNYSLLDYDVEAHKTGEKAEESVRAGFKAQDLARYFTANYNNECFNDIVQHDFETDPKTGKTADSYSVNYADLIPFMFQAIKEQQELIENQHKEIEDLKTTIDNILKRA